MVPPLLRRLLHALGGWVLVFGLTAVVVHPEGCRVPSTAELDRTATRAVDWFGANIDDAGDFTYRYDRDRSVDEGGYSDTRHAGVMWSLWQAESAGIDGAGEIAERAFARIERLLVDTPLGPALGTGSQAPTGAIGLLVAALDERRAATGLTDHDELLRGLGQTLAAVVNRDGSVSASIDVSSGVHSGRSPFFTGEILWALSRLHLTFPDDGLAEPARRIRHYLVTDRDRVEEHWPPVSDHWGAYAFETMDRWPDPPATSAADDEWLDRQLGLFGLQVRYESQRQGGITRLTRGPIALAAGVGTLGEGLGNHLLWLDRNGQRTSDRGDLIARADCAAALLVDRQITPEQASTDAEPARTMGAWFRLGDTQMDDQQHALSAVLLLRQYRATLASSEATS